jgi:hypothetical protein
MVLGRSVTPRVAGASLSGVVCTVVRHIDVVATKSVCKKHKRRAFQSAILCHAAAPASDRDHASR